MNTDPKLNRIRRDFQLRVQAIMLLADLEDILREHAETVLWEVHRIDPDQAPLAADQLANDLLLLMRDYLTQGRLPDDNLEALPDVNQLDPPRTAPFFEVTCKTYSLPEYEFQNNLLKVVK